MMPLQDDHTASLEQEHEHRTQASSSFSSGQTTAVPSPSPSREHLPNGKSKEAEGEQRKAEDEHKFLSVPLQPPPPRRPSVQSTYSDFSELSYHPTRQHAPLMRTDSYASDHDPTPRSPLMRKLRSIWITYYGAMLVLCAQMFGTLMNLSTRLLETPGEHGEAMHPFQILFVRQGITAAVCIIYACYTKSIPDFPLGPRGVRWLLVLRGIGGFFGVFGMYFSLLYLPLSEATVLTFIAPIMTCYVCSLVLSGEGFTRQQQLAAFVSLAGVILIARPHALFALIFEKSSSTSLEAATNTTSNAAMPSGFNSTEIAHPSPSSSNIAPPSSSQHLAAIGISMIGVVGSTCAMTSIRAIGTRAHPFVSINYFSVWCTFVSLVSLIIFKDVKFRLPANFTEWGLLASLGVCGFVMQWLLTEGLAYGSASNAKQPSNRDVVDVEADENGRKSRTSADMRRQSKNNRVIKGAGTRATSMVYTQMLFALAGDKVVFGVVPTVLSWLGSGLILAGAIWVAAAKVQPTADATSSALALDQQQRRGSLIGAGGAMELNAVAATAVDFGAANDDPARQDEVGLMQDIDDHDALDVHGDDDTRGLNVASPSGSSGVDRS